MPSVSRFGGSWAFISSFALVLIIYTCINVMLGRQGWDPCPFILLNLFLSMLAAIQAPIIMMSQNRQDNRWFSIFCPCCRKASPSTLPAR